MRPAILALTLAWLLWPAEREPAFLLAYSLTVTAVDVATVQAPPCGAGVAPEPGRPCLLRGPESL